LDQLRDPDHLRWPVLRRYDQEHTGRIALPIGGIGTGTVSLGGRGNLQDREIVNRPANGFTPGNTFFAIRTFSESGEPTVRALEGTLPAELYEGWSGSSAANAGLPCFRHYSFESAYPFGAVLLNDPDVPVDVRIEAFNPLIPGDADLSGIPVAVLRFVLTNKTAETIQVAVCGSMPNFIATDGSLGAPQSNHNSFRNHGGIQGIFLQSQGVSREAEQWGTWRCRLPPPVK
jgi:non-lysosomal glucosylceramidase